MALSIQYYNGTDYTQFGLDVADYTISAGLLATQFYSIKDNSDTLWIWGLNYANDNNKTVLLAVSSTGVKRRAILNGNSFTCKDKGQLIILRNGDLALQCYVNGTSTGLYGVSKDFVGTGEEIVPYAIKPIGDNAKFAIYQDRYIWVARGTTVKIYDYTTKVELASYNSLSVGCLAFVINPILENGSVICYALDSGTFRTHRIEFSEPNVVSGSILIQQQYSMAYTKQMLIDKYGDLIILTNSGTASTLLKYTTAGVWVDTKTLGQASYNLAIDVDGNYFYYTALKEFQIDKNTAQGQAFTSVGYETRGTGNTGFGSNSTGYQPSVYA